MTRYFFDTIKKTIVLFANEFNGINVVRQADDGSYTQTIPVELIIANKAKFYKRLMKPSEQQNIVLPAISIWNDSMDYNIQLQKNPQFYSKVVSRQDEDLMKILGTPSPFTFTFSVLVKTKYYSDMRQIMETIIPKYQPKVTRRINLIPEFDLSLNIPIVLDSVTPNFEIETGDDPESIRSLECEFSFRVESWVFPPIDELDIARTIKMSGVDITSNQSPTDIVNNNLISASGITKTIIKSIDVVGKGNGVYRINATEMISSNGEYFSIKDSGGECPFVFEYDNMECYGKDYLIPDNLTLTKTGYIYVRANHSNVSEEIPETWKFTFWSSLTRNHQIAQNVFRQYDDFNYRTLNQLRIERQREIDKCYADDGDLYVYSPASTSATMQKVFCVSDFSNFEEFRIGLSNFVFEDNTIISGIRSLDLDEITIETSVSTVSTYEFKIKENGATLDTFTLSSLPSEIRFEKGKIIIGSNTTTINTKYFMFWLGANTSTIFRYSYFRGF